MAGLLIRRQAEGPRTGNTWWPGGTHGQMTGSPKRKRPFSPSPIDRLYLLHLYSICPLFVLFSWMFSKVLLFFLFCFVFPLLFYLVPVNRSVVQDSVMTTSCCAGLMLDYSRRLLASRAEALYCVRPECAHCRPSQHTPSTLYFPARDLYPSVIPLSSVP